VKQLKNSHRETLDLSFCANCLQNFTDWNVAMAHKCDMQRAVTFKVEDTMAPESVTESTNPKDLIGSKKPRLSLVPPSGFVYAALAMANGADKYGPYNWREKKVQVMIYLEAAMRHILSYQDGEENALDSGVPHLGHALACLLIIIDALETGNLVDNRPVPGSMAKLIERFTKKGA
jgi:hypothetical protein